MAVTFDGHAEGPRRHPVRNFLMGAFGLTAAVGGGAALENRTGVVDQGQRFIGGLLAQRDSGSASAQTLGESRTETTPAVEPVRLVADTTADAGGAREESAQLRIVPTAYNAERGTTVTATPGYRFVDYGDGVVRECSEDGSICIRKNEYRFE